MLFSIIVPVYNVEKYLRDALRSALEQSFSDFEIILIDDGSPDNCPSICDEFASLDHRVNVIHQQNGGVSAARNAGVQRARGDYLVFLDGDDLLAPGALGIYAEQILQSKDPLNIVIAKYMNLIESKLADCNYSLEPHACCTLKDTLKALFLDLPGYGMRVWGYAFRRVDIVQKGLIFDTNLFYAEDAHWLMHAITSAERFCIVDYPAYYYRNDNHDSIMHKRPNMNRYRSSYYVFTYWFDYFKDYDGEARQGLLSRMADGYVNMSKWICMLPIDERKEAIQMFKNRVEILNYSKVRVNRLLQPFMKAFGVVFYSRALSIIHFLTTKLKTPVSG